MPISLIKKLAFLHMIPPLLLSLLVYNETKDINVCIFSLVFLMMLWLSAIPQIIDMNTKEDNKNKNK